MALSDTSFRFRLVVVGAQLATLAVTWPLWTAHVTPPMLPVLPLPEVGFGPALVVAALAQVVAPKRGVLAFGVLFSLACLADETRAQPQLVSLLFLSAATWPEAGARFIGRVHLLVLWAWAGLHKVTSPAFLNLLGPRFVRDVWPDAPGVLTQAAGGALAMSEFVLAVLLFTPRTRRWAGWLTLGLHVGILLTLAAGANENASVWAWNFVLALSGVALFEPWREGVGFDFRRQSAAVKALALTLAVFPLGWSLGLVDAYFAHHLYSVDVPVPDAPSKPFRATWRRLHVPIPPEHRLFHRLFDATCVPGETLTVKETRLLFAGTTTRRCERTP